MYIAIDDTDSKDGMCTTFLATEIIREFSEYQLLSYPHLVRLNPNIPWKTRGNGAVVLELGAGKTASKTIGDIEGAVQVWDGDPDIDIDIVDRLKSTIESWADFHKEGTDPGFVLGYVRPPRGLYEDAVSSVVELGSVTDILDESGLIYSGLGNRRGIIGAAAALAWTPHDHTFELIAYRRRCAWGTSRDIDVRDVVALDASTDKTFDTYDHLLRKQAIAPSSPCPVLYGIRGDDPSELTFGLDMIRSEAPDRWLTFLTNQGTDDHISDMEISRLEPYLSCHISGEVSSHPFTISGGHVFFELSSGKRRVTAAAYEPTKSFRDYVRRLIPGDRLELWGGVRDDGETVNIEKMRVVKLVESMGKAKNPICDRCGKSMSSMGKGAGYRCKRCRTKADEEEAQFKILDRDIEEGWYEVPVSARRHLSKPLKRMGP